MLSQSSVAQAIQKELGSFISTEAHKDTDIVRYINSALNYIANYRDFPFLKAYQTIVYNTPNIIATLSSYVLKTYGVNGDKDIHILDQATWFFPENRPWNVCIEGTVFIAEESGTYELLYKKNPTPVTSLTTEIDIPSQFETALTNIAIHFWHKDRQFYDKANALLGAANAELNLLAERISDPTPKQTRIMSRNHRI